MGAALQLHDLIVRLAVALALGAAIGAERQWHQKMAGLRTNTLVAIGSAGFVILGVLASPDAGPMDPRIAAQIVTGIGFLGAGVILREGVNVHGLNTAATLWCSAMVGALAGAGYLAAGLCGAGFVVLTNLGLRPVIQRLNARLVLIQGMETHYTITVACRAAADTATRERLLRAIPAAGLDLRQIDSNVGADGRITVTARALHPTRADAAVEALVAQLLRETGVEGASWSVLPVIPEA
jgi:putative Mg2+ transporter-C (MgtC) family protein